MRQPAQRVDGQLKLLVARYWRLADLSRRDLHVLLADRLDDVGGAQIQRRQLVGVQPRAQAVIALTQIRDARDARQASQFVLDVDRGVVAQKDAVVALVG